MIDFALQRLNMVESQLRPSDITDRRILRAMGEIHREAFLPAQLQAVAYMDEDIRIARPAGGNRLVLAPRTLAKLVQLARVEPSERVLEVGCCSGYGTAVIARLCGEVFSIEADAELARMAVAALDAASVSNAKVANGPLVNGIPQEAPYDAIIVNGAVMRMSDALLDQLKDGGRLVAIVAAPGTGMGRAVVWRRNGSSFDDRAAFDAQADVLPGFELHPEFAL